MADLSLASSGYQTGSIDTWTDLVNNVTPHRAEHVNGPVSAILQIEAVLGSGATLPGTKATLAQRLDVQIPADGKVFPVGAGLDFFGSVAPNGWLFRDGSAVSRTTFSDLFAVIGTTYGAGDGSTTFNLPDDRCRVTVGAGTGIGGGSSGTGTPAGGDALTTRALGQWGGEESHTLTSGESGTASHVHGFSGNVMILGGVGNTTGGGGTPFGTISQTGSGVTADAAEAHNNMMPYLVCNKIIKY